MGVVEMSDSDESWESDTGEDVEYGEKTKCLFSDDMMPSSAAALEHDRTHFGFDIERYIAQVRGSCYSLWVLLLLVRQSPLAEVWHVSDDIPFGTQVRMDEYEVIKCINYIRESVKAGRDPRSELACAVSTPHKPWQDDKYLIPVLPDDAMLFHELSSDAGGLPSSSSRYARPLSAICVREANMEAQ